MSPTIRWEVEGLDEAQKTLLRWSTRLRNPQPAFNDMMDHLAVVQKDWFATQGGGSWPQLSEPYRTWKKKRFPKRGILHGPDRPGHRGLQLRDQLTRRPFGFEFVNSSGFELGTRGLDYARVHQIGQGLPKRPPLKGVDQKTAEVLARILRDHVIDQTMGDNG